MKVLVTGAYGMLGRDLCPMFEKEGYEVIKTGSNNLDITNSIQVNTFIKSKKPEIILHCAAYTNVDKAESDKENAYKVNVSGSENIAKAAFAIDATVVYISTDYVFDGKKTTPYLPNDIPNPLSIYGLTKYQGEEKIKEFSKKYYIARTSWLYGIYGKNFVETMINLSSKKELSVVENQIGCPTWTVELTKGILRLIKEKRPYGIYHISGGGATSRYDFVKEIYRQLNLKVNLKPCKDEDFPQAAKRPLYSVLDNDNIIRNWNEALCDYLKLRSEKP